MDEWRKRLLAEISRATAEGASLRSLSLGAGLSANYVEQLISRGSNPTVPVLEKLCAQLGVSLIYILTGTEADPASEAILRLVNSLSPEDQRHAMALLERLAATPARTTP